MDGRFAQVLRSSGPFQVADQQEELVEAIYWLYGSASGLDLSAAWSLGAYLDIMSFCCEGWTWNYPANWLALTEDKDEATLTAGFSFDLEEHQDYGNSVGGEVDAGGYPAKFAAPSWTTARLEEYRPWGLEIIQGGIHGLSTSRNSGAHTVERREQGTADAWTQRTDSLATDGHGYFYWGNGYDDLFKDYDGTNPVIWEYRVDGAASLGRLFLRQWIAGLLGGAASTSLCHFRAFTGRPHVFYVKAADGNLWERIYDTET